MSSKEFSDVHPLKSSNLNITTRKLHQPPLDELMDVLREGVTKNFAEASVELVDCPNLTEKPYNFPREGLCGNPVILDIGGPSHLIPFYNREKYYNLKTLLQQLNYKHNTLAIGAGAGPWPSVGVNCELIMKVNLINDKPTTGYSEEMAVVNGTHYVTVHESTGECVLQRLARNQDEATFALMANLYLSEGKREKVIKVQAKKRTGNLDFITCMQKELEKRYGDNLVGLGGMFEIKNGKVKQHVMPDFSKAPLNTEADLNNWLRFYDMQTPLIAVGVFVSAETDLDLRVQHFHSAFDDNKLGGHYHIDTTPDTIEYVGYFNMAATLYRVDQPPIKMKFGKD